MTSPPADWSPFARANAIGDPGRQPEIAAVSGALNVGVPDTALDFLSLDPLEIRACASRGWSHRYKGIPRQDSYSVLTTDELVVIAVADGVSEGDFSQVAAETAARSACKLVADQRERQGAVDWVQLARRISMRIIDEAEYRQISQPQGADGAEPTIDERLQSCLTTMSTTLIVAVLVRLPDHRGFAAEIGVVAGDSAAYVLRAGSDVLDPAGGGKASGESITSTRVRPLPGVVTPEVVELHLHPGDALVIGSDGIGDPVGDGDGEVGRELARRWAEPPTIDRFLLDVNSYRRSFDDDRTAVGVWVRPDVVLPEQPEQPDQPGQSDDGQPGQSDDGTTETTAAIEPAPEADSPLPVKPASETPLDPPAEPEARQAPSAPEPEAATPRPLPHTQEAADVAVGLAPVVATDATAPDFRPTEFPKES